MYDKVAQLLAERGETFADLARGTGIKTTTIYQFKARKSNLSVKNANKVAHYLGISIDELLREDR